MASFECCALPLSAPVRLTIEARRRKLMKENQYRRWGDNPDMDAIRRRQTEDISLEFSSWLEPEHPPSSGQSVFVTSEDESQPFGVRPRSLYNTTRAAIVDCRLPPLGAQISSPDRIMAASTKGWSLDFLISKAPITFRHADRVSAKLPSADLNARIKQYERSGLPLVIEGFHELDNWPKDELNLDRFVERAAEDTVSVRNVHNWTDSRVKLTDFVEKARSMSPYVQENETERWYGKDMECPQVWEEWVRTGNVVPSALLGNGPHDLFRYRPESAPVQTLMCYLGIGDTFTPCHKDLCASSGQNLMCYTENDGSSFWFMTASSVAPKASKYFQQLRHELDHENHVVTIEELANAPFEVYILQQKLGDLVLVPPRSCHQVVNSGGITVKTSWSRMTLKGLITAYYHEIPIYRRVCRPEIYKVKSTIFHVMIGQTRELENLRRKAATSSTSLSLILSNLPKRMARISSNSNQDSPLEALANSLKELVSVADSILTEEYDKLGEKMPNAYTGSNRFIEESSLTCDFCGGDIFQSFFECGSCVEGGISSGDRLHICPGCYVDGRTCKCSKLQPWQYGNFQELVEVRNKAVEAISSYEGLQGRTFSAELKLTNESMPQVFRAACRLYSNRLIPVNPKKKERVCTSRNKHTMAPHDRLNCRGCHNSKCFRHILESHKVHAVDALLCFAADKTPTHQKYHANHLSKSSNFREELLALERDQTQGTRHSGYSQLVFNALNYGHCDPIRHKQFLNGGWYDNYEFMDDDEEDLHSPAEDDNNLRAKTSPPASVENSPKIKIKFSSAKSKSLSVAADPPSTKSSGQEILLKAKVNSRNNLLRADSVDSDDIPLAPPSVAPSRDNSDSEDIEMVDAEIRVEDNEASTSGGSEPAIKPRKRMIPYVLVPRLRYHIKSEEDTNKGKPVLSPPYPTRMHSRELRPRPSQSQPQSPQRKAGSGRNTRSSKTISSEPEVRVTAQEAAVSSTSIKPITFSSHPESQPSSSSSVSTPSTATPLSTPSKVTAPRLPGTVIRAKSGLVAYITTINEQPHHATDEVRKRQGSFSLSDSDAPSAKSNGDDWKTLRIPKKQKPSNDKVNAAEDDVSQGKQTVTNNTFHPLSFFDDGVQALSTNLYSGSPDNVPNTSSSSNSATPSSSTLPSASIPSSSSEPFQHSIGPSQQGNTLQQHTAPTNHLDIPYDKIAGAMLTALGNVMHRAADSVAQSPGVQQQHPLMQQLPASATPSIPQTAYAPSYPGQAAYEGYHPPWRHFPSRGFSGQYYGGRRGPYQDTRHQPYYSHNRNPNFQHRQGGMHPYFKYQRNNNPYRDRYAYGDQRVDHRPPDLRFAPTHSPPHQPEREPSVGTKILLRRQVHHSEYVDNQGGTPTMGASGSGQSSSQHVDTQKRALPLHPLHPHVEYQQRAHQHQHQEQGQSRSSSSPSRRSPRKDVSQQPIASTSRLYDPYGRVSEERLRDSTQSPFESRVSDDRGRKIPPRELVSRDAHLRHQIRNSSCDDSSPPNTPADEGGFVESTSKPQSQQPTLEERLSSPRPHHHDKSRSGRRRSSRNGAIGDKGKGKEKEERERMSISPSLATRLGPPPAADERDSPRSWTNQVYESRRNMSTGGSNLVNADTMSSQITAPHLEPTHSPSVSSESESTLHSQSRKRPSRFGPLVNGNDNQVEEDDSPREARGSPRIEYAPEEEEGDEDVPVPAPRLVSSRQHETRSGNFVYVDPSPQESGEPNAKEKGKGRLHPSRVVADVDMDTATPRNALAILNDGDSGPAFPEPELGSGSVAQAQTSRVVGGAGGGDEADADSPMRRGSGDHRREEQEETAESEEEKEKEFINSRRQEEEEAAPIRMEEEEDEEAQNWENTYAQEDEEPESRPQLALPLLERMSFTPIVPMMDRGEDERGEDEVSLDEEDDCGGLARRSLTLIVPTMDRDDDEVSLGEEDDCGGPAMMSLFS